MKLPWSKKEEEKKPLPIFCKECGCKLIRKTQERSPDYGFFYRKRWFDEQTGQGKMSVGEVLICPKITIYAKSWYHTLIDLEIYSIIDMEGGCDA